jgi:hypothetical protein
MQHTCDQFIPLKPAKFGINLTLALFNCPPLVLWVKLPVEVGHAVRGRLLIQSRISPTTAHDAVRVGGRPTDENRSTFMPQSSARSGFPFCGSCVERHAHTPHPGCRVPPRASGGAGGCGVVGGAAGHHACDTPVHRPGCWGLARESFARFRAALADPSRWRLRAWGGRCGGGRPLAQRFLRN